MSEQLGLFTEEPIHFDGRTYDPAQDYARLDSLLGRVWRLMQDHQWHTLAQIRGLCGGTEASVSARLRDFRKAKFGGFAVERRRMSGHSGWWEYRVALREVSS